MGYPDANHGAGIWIPHLPEQNHPDRHAFQDLSRCSDCEESVFFGNLSDDCSGFSKILQDQVNNGACSGIFHGKYLDLLNRWRFIVYRWESHDIMVVGWMYNPGFAHDFVSKSTRHGEFSVSEVPQIPSLKQRRFFFDLNVRIYNGWLHQEWSLGELLANWRDMTIPAWFPSKSFGKWFPGFPSFAFDLKKEQLNILHQIPWWFIHVWSQM